MRDFRSVKILVIAFMIVFFANCAKRGSITGGSKDTIAPKLLASYPKNFSVNFDKREIKLVFDENIKLKNVKKQLIISPPLKQDPIISTIAASKYITLKINDTLQKNTTYSFNFGQSIEDNNEGNPYNQFKYVFSTGSYIDSLSISGKIKDALSNTTDNFVSVMLYEVTESSTDSIIYNESPSYITNTLDSLQTFKMENLKAGNYLLVALKDRNGNNKFNPKKEKLGFIKKPVKIPTDSLFEISLFQEKSAFKAIRPSQQTKNKILLGYEGSFDNEKPEITLKKSDSIIQHIITKVPQKDSLYVWHKNVQSDSLAFSIKHKNFSANYNIKTRSKKTDSLSFTASHGGNINFNDVFEIESSTPLVKINEAKIELIQKDSSKVAFTTKYDDFTKKLQLNFVKNPSEKYQLRFLPGAMIDFFENQNDSLFYRLDTKTIEEFGNLNVALQNIKSHPVILDLTNEKGDIIASQYLEKETEAKFKLLPPGSYNLRIIYDTNKNKRFDTGNFLQKLLPEEVIYLSNEIDLRANWDIEQVFDASQAYNRIKKKKETKKEAKPKKGFGL